MGLGVVSFELWVMRSGLSIGFKYKIGKLDTEENRTNEINKLSTNNFINLRERFLSHNPQLTTCPKDANSSKALPLQAD